MTQARRTRVAIVEDDDLIAMALAAMLQQAGATVVAAAHTHDAAITMVDSGPPCDVVFVDLWLHGKLTGIEVARHAALKGVSVVVMTGEVALPDELTGVGLLSKPFSVEQVRAVLQAIGPADRDANRDLGLV